LRSVTIKKLFREGEDPEKSPDHDFTFFAATLCGNTAPSNVTFQRQPGNNFQFRVVFHTDNTVVRKGFLARYAVVEA